MFQSEVESVASQITRETRAIVQHRNFYIPTFASREIV